jgi:hypothetical protein
MNFLDRKQVRNSYRDQILKTVLRNCYCSIGNYLKQEATYNRYYFRIEGLNLSIKAYAASIIDMI